MADVNNGFLLVAALCLVFTIGLSTEIANNLGVAVPFDLDHFMRVRERIKLLLGIIGAMIATAQGAMIYTLATGSPQQVTIAGVELLGSSAWIALLVRNYLARRAS